VDAAEVPMTSYFVPFFAKELENQKRFSDGRLVVKQAYLVHL